jgi:hypothetical protein
MIALNCGSEQTVSCVLLPFFIKYPIYGVKAITLLKLILILELVINSRGSRKTTKWTPELKSQVLNIWKDNQFRLKGDATVDLKKINKL